MAGAMLSWPLLLFSASVGQHRWEKLYQKRKTLVKHFVTNDVFIKAAEGLNQFDFSGVNFLLNYDNTRERHGVWCAL
jgi:hypothetical protein